MTAQQLSLLCAGVFAVAFLYSCVGHAGASGYIAVMTLFGLAPDIVKPTALALNVIVSSLASWQFWRAGHFAWTLFWPFAALSTPCAFAGGALRLPAPAFQALVGLVLLWSAAVLLLRPPPDEVRATPSGAVRASVGAGMGLLAGLTGTGGGIFLTPLLLFMRWARARTAAATSAVFILVNSLAGLLGHAMTTGELPAPAPSLAVAVLAGGAAGSYLGSTRLSHAAIKRVLAAVLVIAGAKLLLHH